MSFPIKHPAEQVYAGVDWADALDDGETISGTPVVLATVKRGTGRDANPSAIISGSATASGSVVSQLIVGGVAGVDYDTYWRITTSNGRTLEERVPLLVR